MDLDYEFDERECLKCGYSPTHIRHCSECHGEGEFDCYDDDPINFSPGEEFETCETCSGSGIEHWCPKCGADQAEMRLNEQEITVIFDMWGQRCQTTFDATSELDPLTWLSRMHSKGWLRPVEVVMANGVVLYDQQALLAFEWDA